MILLHKSYLEGSGFGEATSGLNLWCRGRLERIALLTLEGHQRLFRPFGTESPEIIWGWGCLEAICGGV